MVITEPAGVTFGSHVTIYPSRQSQLRQEVRVFSVDKGNIRAPAELISAHTQYIATVLDTHCIIFPQCATGSCRGV